MYLPRTYTELKQAWLGNESYPAIENGVRQGVQ